MRRTLAALAAAMVLPVAGCSTASGTTCNEYAGMDGGLRSDVERDLLIEHDLDPNHTGNMLGVRESVNNFCGLTGLGALVEGSESATQNNTSPLEEAVDWDSEYW